MTEKHSDRFGIDIKKFCRDHEAYIRSKEATRELYEYHLEKLRWLQHERLVHLIVTVMVVIGEIFLVSLVLLHPELGIVPAIMMLGIAILAGLYFMHYFFLENTVQKWYHLADEIYHGLGDK